MASLSGARSNLSFMKPTWRSCKFESAVKLLVWSTFHNVVNVHIVKIWFIQWHRCLAVEDLSSFYRDDVDPIKGSATMLPLETGITLPYLGARSTRTFTLHITLQNRL